MSTIGGVLFSLAIKASIILIAAYVVTFAMRRASASARRFVWVIAAASLLVLPVLSLLLPPMAIGHLWTGPLRNIQPRVFSADTVVTVRTAAVRSGSAPHTSLPAESWVFLVWAAGVFVVLGRLATGMARMWWLARAAKQIDIPEGSRDLQARIGVDHVRFVESGRIAMPMTWGVTRPVILLPAGRQEWPAERLRLVLAHELIHVQKRDCLFQLLMQIVCALYWFHPLAWLGAAQFRKERERACDDGVLSLGVQGPEYAGHLLELVRSLKPGARPVLAVAMAHQSNLETRLVALLDAKVSRKQLSRKAALLTILAGACAVIPLACVNAQAQSATGTISGVIYDPSGAVIPYVTVLATNPDTHKKEMAVCNAAGQYTLQSIPAGHYTLEVKAPGFKVFHRDAVLNASDSLHLDVAMEIGGVDERVEVEAQKPAGQVTSAVTPKRIRVGGMVSSAKLIWKVPPVYPEYAKQQGIEGVVLLQAIISKEGNVLSLKVQNSADPDLAQAATNAVQQWHYEPTLLNGEPVEVVTTITVDFRLKP